jgi:hypothetical protein
MFKPNKENHKVLTPDGYKLFDGIQKINKAACKVVCKTGESLTCSLKHPLCIDVHNFKFKQASELVTGDNIFHTEGWKEVVNVTEVGEIDLYDLINVEDTVSYYTDGFLSHNCEFLSTGESSIDDDLFEEMFARVREPKILLDEGNYKIWEEADPSRLYVAGVDTAEGVGADSSCIQILDITDIKDIRQVACYNNNKIPPLEFATKVYSILRNYGSPLALIERNNCGAQVVDRLAKDIGYEKIVSYGNKAAHRKNVMLGMIAHTNTKYQGVLNMRYFINDVKAVQINDMETLTELKNFVRWPNGTWKARRSHHDDMVMSLLYALFILEKDITERFFEILEFDDRGKPAVIEQMDFGIQYFEDATSLYLDNEIVGDHNSALPPVVFGMGDSQMQDDMDELTLFGYTPLA